MRSNAIIAALVLALAAAPTVAQEASDNNAPAQQPPAQVAATTQTQSVAPATSEPDPGEEVICRRDRATGSLTRVNRVCKTRNEWNGVHDSTRDNMNDLQRNASGGAQCVSLGRC